MGKGQNELSKEAIMHHAPRDFIQVTLEQDAVLQFKSKPHLRDLTRAHYSLTVIQIFWSNIDFTVGDISYKNPQLLIEL